MRLYSLGQVSNEEKSNILDKHREVYNGYRRMQNEVPNEQPLYVQDFAGDKDGITINNKGEVKKYTNFGINEQEINQFESEMDEEAEICSECGGGMYEGECNECGWKGDMEEGIYDEEDLNLSDKFDYVEGLNDEDIALSIDNQNPDLALAMSEDADYEMMSSAFDEEIDEVTGPSPLYSEIDFPAYNFKSDGPTQAKGPYHQNEEMDEFDFDDRDTAFSRMKRGMGDIEDIDWEDIEDDERDTAFDRMKRGVGDVEDIEWEEIDEDLQESFITQKNKINEMLNRMNKYN